MFCQCVNNRLESLARAVNLCQKTTELEKHLGTPPDQSYTEHRSAILFLLRNLANYCCL